MDEYQFVNNFATQLTDAFSQKSILSQSNNGKLETAVKNYVENQSRDAIREFTIATLRQTDNKRKSFHERELQFVEYSQQFLLKLKELLLVYERAGQVILGSEKKY